MKYSNTKIQQDLPDVMITEKKNSSMSEKSHKYIYIYISGVSFKEHLSMAAPISVCEHEF